jgi:hypothetical protein
MPGKDNQPKTPFSDETIIRRSGNQLSCDLDGEAAILHVATGQYFGLNEVGALVWERLENASSVGALRQALLEEYEVEDDRCRSDLESLLRELADSGLVEIGDERPE